ncbi:retrovirus-related pol polyprotein from transposon TNT 1-94 [Tanacetum coccineum]
MALALMARHSTTILSTPNNKTRGFINNLVSADCSRVVQDAVQYQGVQNYGKEDWVNLLGTVQSDQGGWDAVNVDQLLIAQKEEAGIQLQAEEFDLMAAAADLDEIEEVNATDFGMTDQLSSGKQITTLNEEISKLSKQLSTEKSTVSSLLEEKKKLKSDFKIREDELLDKQIQLENKIKELDNILVKTGQSIQTMHMLSPKPDSFYHTEQKMALGYQNPFYLKQAQRKHQCLYDGKVLLEKHDPPVVHDSEETLQLAQESRQKMKQLNKEIKPANYTKINHLSGIFVSKMAKSQEEVYFVNTSKTATVSKSISIPNEEFLDDTTLSVARKFLNECCHLSQASLVRTLKQNGVVERKNRTLVEAARTMLIFSRAPLFLWAEAIATMCYTQNRSIIHRRFDKTPYELINGRKPDISFLYVFGAFCYPKNDREDIRKLGAKGDIGFLLVILLILVLTEFTTEGQRKSWRP